MVTIKKISKTRGKKKLLITGGAGFIGVNAAKHFLQKGYDVTIFDNFSRRGSSINLQLLKKETRGIKGSPRVVRGDVVTDAKALGREVNKADVVLHLAAQVAVTTSIVDPRADFETNTIGTFNVLEAARLSKKRPILLYSSTNKVYGSLPHLSVKELKTRYVFDSRRHAKYGVGENEQLDFHSPYGCSKGAADQYVIDYSRIYGLQTVVFRQSCIYGPSQFGVEDQGWVAWFTIAVLLGRPITLYGSGKQVRDLLHVSDLVQLYDLAIKNIKRTSGSAYNVGGGPSNTISLIELMAHLEERMGKKIRPKHSGVRAGDQPVFIADIRRLKDDLGWKPCHSVLKGWEDMYQWIVLHEADIRKVLK
ncbi:MAG: GDP-mannose 4,6-dehydratase [Patescibacteria group bacterium]|nr:GDP-mannose 4,6-dehydratase [Patescibacteria group bacterium]